MNIDAVWDYLLRIHTAADWSSLIVLYGIGVGGLCLLLLEILHARTSTLARRQQARLAELIGELHALAEREAEMSERLDEAKKTLRNRIDRAEQAVADRIDAKTDRLLERIAEAERNTRQARNELDSVRERLTSAEQEFPVFEDRLAELQNDVDRLFRTELSSVLDSFDSSVSAVLDHMKDQLQMGVSRIEGVESMVESRQKASRSLLGPSQDSEPEAAPSRTEREDIEEDVEDRPAQAPPGESEAEGEDAESEPDQEDEDRPEAPDWI